MSNEIEHKSDNDYAKSVAYQICEQIQHFSPTVNMYGKEIKLNFFKTIGVRQLLYAIDKETNRVRLYLILKRSKKRIRIDLNGKDLYDLRIYKTVNYDTLEQKVYYESKDIYFDQLTDEIIRGLNPKGVKNDV